jgi:hypothetical protein
VNNNLTRGLLFGTEDLFLEKDEGFEEREEMRQDDKADLLDGVSDFGRPMAVCFALRHRAQSRDFDHEY